MMLTVRREELACRRMVELVTDYLEGALPRRDRKRFERHLRGCPNCTAYLEQMRTTITRTGRLTPDDLTPEARDEFTRLFRSWTVPGGSYDGGSGDGGSHDDASGVDGPD